MTITGATANYISGYVDIGSAADPLDLYFGSGDTDAFFETSIRKIAPFTHLPTPMKVSGGQVENPSYTVFKSADVLLYAPEIFTLPEVRVKSSQQATYKIYWTRNATHNLAAQGQITVTDVPISSFDTVVQDQMAQHIVEPGKFKVYNKMIGNLSPLVTPGSYLPPTQLVNMGQWTFDRPGSGLMLCCATNNQINLVMTHLTDLTKLIRVQKFTAGTGGAPGTWNDVANTTYVLSDIIDVTGGWNNMNLKMPEMWGEYAVFSDDERYHHTSRVIDQIVLLYPKSSTAEVTAGATKLDFNFHYPLRALFYNALNTTSAQYNNYSNYTTDPIGDDGINPIRTTSYQYDGSARFENLPNIFTSDIYPYKHAARCPQDVGYNAIFYCMRLASVQMDGWTEPNRIDTSLSFNIVETSTDAGHLSFTGSKYRVELRGQCVNIVRYQRESLGFPNLETKA